MVLMEKFGLLKFIYFMGDIMQEQLIIYTVHPLEIIGKLNEF